jgi:hypothetical protein
VIGGIVNADPPRVIEPLDHVIESLINL